MLVRNRLRVDDALDDDRKRDTDTNAKLPKTRGRKNEHAEKGALVEEKLRNLRENNIVT